jgi:hypothetical protein
MTLNRKILIGKLLKGYYLIAWKNGYRTGCYRLYNHKGIIDCNIGARTVKGLDKYIDPKIKIWKRDKAGRMTLNLSMVRRLHGRNMIKKLYLESKEKQ